MNQESSWYKDTASIDSEWIHEIADFKPEHFPALESFTVYGEPDEVYSGVVTWLPPTEMSDLFEANGIGLRVLLRDD